jgi:hypothetical protein
MEKVERCYENASILNKFSQYLDLIQTRTGKTSQIDGLPTQLTQLLVDINPSLAEAINKNDFVRKNWADAEVLKNYIVNGITPIIRIAIKNHLLQTFKYKPSHDVPLLEPSAASNDFRISRQDERIAALEAKQVKVDIVAETLAREVGDLRQAKATAAFEREEYKIKLTHQDKDAWSKVSEELKKTEITTILEG